MGILRCMCRPSARARANAELVAVRVHQRHGPVPLDPDVWRLLDRRPFAPEVGVPGVDVRDEDTDKPADLAIVRVLGEVECHPVTRDLHAYGHLGIEAALPIDLETE